jgi:hypothetical protein
MTNDDVHAQKAKEIANDEHHQGDLTEDEAVLLEQLLREDAGFGAIVTAHWNAVRIDEHSDLGDTELDTLTQAAGAIASVRESIVEAKKQRARGAIRLQRELDAAGGGHSWVDALRLYVAGYESLEDLRGESQFALREHDEVPPELAKRTRAVVKRAETEVAGDD